MRPSEIEGVMIAVTVARSAERCVSEPLFPDTEPLGHGQGPTTAGTNPLRTTVVPCGVRAEPTRSFFAAMTSRSLLGGSDCQVITSSRTTLLRLVPPLSLSGGLQRVLHGSYCICHPCLLRPCFDESRDLVFPILFVARGSAVRGRKNLAGIRRRPTDFG